MTSKAFFAIILRSNHVQRYAILLSSSDAGHGVQNVRYNQSGSLLFRGKSRSRVMKKERLETMGDVIMRQVVVLTMVVIWLAGCATTSATAPAFRAATADEAAQYGLKPGAHRYEYPDAVVFTTTENTPHPEVVHDGRPLSISVDADQTADMAINSTSELVENGVVRATETIKTCVPNMEKCSVMVQSTVLVMRPKPVKVNKVSVSMVTSEVSTEDGTRVLMLKPTETSLRALVLKAVQLREDPPRPGGDCKQSHRLAGDFIGVVHAQFEKNAIDLLEQDGYIPIHRVIQAELQLVDYEMGKRGCINDFDRRTAAIADGERLLDRIFAPYMDPSGLVIDLNL